MSTTKVLITPEAYQKLFLYAGAVKDEISGLGRVIKVGEDLHIVELFLLKQEVSSASTDLDDDDVAEFLSDYIAEGKKPEELKLWWHSHANMGVSWSGTDEDTISKFSNGWMLSVVVNRRGESKVRLDVYDPIHLTCNSMDLLIAPVIQDSSLIKEVEAEVKKKVITRDYSSGYWQGGKFVKYIKKEKKEMKKAKEEMKAIREKSNGGSPKTYGDHFSSAGYYFEKDKITGKYRKHWVSTNLPFGPGFDTLAEAIRTETVLSEEEEFRLRSGGGGLW